MTTEYYCVIIGTDAFAKTRRYLIRAEDYSELAAKNSWRHINYIYDIAPRVNDLKCPEFKLYRKMFGEIHYKSISHKAVVVERVPEIYNRVILSKIAFSRRDFTAMLPIAQCLAVFKSNVKYLISNAIWTTHDKYTFIKQPHVDLLIKFNIKRRQVYIARYAEECLWPGAATFINRYIDYK